jgi:hypothetical protein
VKHFSTLSAALLWTALAVAFVLAVDIILGPYLLSHRDLGWHIEAGDLIRAARAIPATDPWSFTAGDTPWYNISWGWDVGAGILYKLGGFSALLLATLAAGALLTSLLMIGAIQSGASPGIACFVTVFACSALPIYAPPDIFFCTAPQTVTLVMCALFYAICASARCLWLLPPLMLLWCNLHGGFPAGFTIIGAFALHALRNRNKPHFLRLMAVALPCLLATLINPLGMEIYTGMLRTIGHSVRGHVSEWQPFFSGMSWPGSALCILYIILFVVYEIRAGKKPEIAARLPAWFWLLMGLKELRYMALFLILSAPLLAAHLSERRLPAKIPNAALIMPLLVMLLALPVLWKDNFPRGVRYPEGIYPEKEVVYLREHDADKRILNHWNYGGYIIFATHGVLPVFIDGRATTAYPDNVISDFTLLPEKKNWSEILTKYKIGAILWPNALEQPMVDSHWHVAFKGDVATVYERVQ